MKRRIKKLESVSGNKELKTYILQETKEGLYKHWGSKETETFTAGEVEALEKAKNTLVLIVKWG